MATDDKEREETKPEQTEEDPPESVDPRDARITALEATLAEVTARADAMAQALFTARVGATGLLVNPEEMAYDATLLDDPEALHAAVLALIQAKPYLARLKVSGDVDQGPREETPPVNLMNILKEYA